MADDLIRTPLKRRTEAAQYIIARFGVPCAPKTLAKLAVIGGGPAFRRAGRIPLYAESDLDIWALSRLSRRVQSTAELAA